MSYRDFQFLLIFYYQLNDLFIDFVTSLPILKDWKEDDYTSILVIIDKLTKIVYFKLFKITINVVRQVQIIIYIILTSHHFPDFIMSNRGALFTSKL